MTFAGGKWEVTPRKDDGQWTKAAVAEKYEDESFP